MCIVIDTNVMPCVFDGRNCQHAEYRPVFNWITIGSGYAVYGGSVYLAELRRSPKYFGFLLELSKERRAKKIHTEAVDAELAIVATLVPPACDDAHLIALFRASGCRLLCSNDRRADIYIRNRDYYQRGQCPPSIYRSRRHKHLLHPRNLVTLRNST